MAGRPATLKVDIVADAKGVSRGVAEADGKLGRLGDSGRRTGKALAAGMGLAVAAAGAMAVKLGVDAVKAAADMGETISKVGVLFGPAAKEIEAFADQAATSMGASKQEALDGAATFATFGKSAGLAGHDLAGFSTELLTAAGDLASFNNASPEETIAAIGAGLRGEAEPLRQFGILMDDATLRSEALKLGLISSTKEALTPQQKVLAAQKVILGQVGAASGDFERTSGSLANQQKITAATVENLKVKLGQGLLPIVTAAATYINSHVIPGVSRFASRMSDALGPAINRVGAFIRTELVPRLQSLHAWFVEKVAPGIRQALLPMLEAAKGAFSGVRRTIADNRENLEKLGSAIQTVAEFVAKYVVPAVGKVAATQFRILGKAISGVIDLVATLVGAIDSAIGKLQALGDAVSNAASKGGNLLGKLPGFSSSATALRSPELMGPSASLVGPAGVLAGPGRATFAWDPFSSGSFSSASSASPVVLDRRTIELNVTVQGALDPTSVARQLEGILDSAAVRLGRVTTYGAGR